MKTKRLWLPLLAIFLAILFISSCKKDDFVTTVGVCPIVVSTDPANLATGVPLDKVITATFNETMDPLTITPASFSLQTGAKGLEVLSGTVTYDGTSSTMKFSPVSKLKPGTTYIATIAVSVKDFNGNSIQEDYVWTFSTGGTISPAVTSTDPINNSVGVLLNKTINASFNQAMDPLSINNNTFVIRQGLNTITGTVLTTGSTATFKPTDALISNTVYTAIITSGGKNIDGTYMADDYVWNFTTGTITAPIVTSTNPIKNATDVPLNKVISAVFNEAMDPLTLTGSSFTLMSETTPVTVTVNYSGTTATFTPTGGLLSGVTYKASISTLVKNLAGVPLANNYEWTFSTNAPLGPLNVDLKSVARFGIIAGVGVSNNAGFSVINNLDVGIYPGTRSSIVGFPPAILVNGALYASDDIAPPGIASMLLQAKNDLVAAYLFAEGATSPAPAIVSGDQGGKTLAPGIYKSTSTLLIQLGDLTLDAQGDANAVWIFQIASSLTTVGGGPYPSPSGGNVILTGGAQAKNVFWQTGSSATIGDYTSFKGSVLALQTITMGAYSQATGRMLARNGAVTMTSTNIINKP